MEKLGLRHFAKQVLSKGRMHLFDDLAVKELEGVPHLLDIFLENVISPLLSVPTKITNKLLPFLNHITRNCIRLFAVGIFDALHRPRIKAQRQDNLRFLQRLSGDEQLLLNDAFLLFLKPAHKSSNVLTFRGQIAPVVQHYKSPHCNDINSFYVQSRSDF